MTRPRGWRGPAVAALIAALALAGCAGRFGGAEAEMGDDAAPAVSRGSPLPFGQIAAACDLDRAQLGGAVEVGGGWSIHDTAPGSTSPRTQYITGFSDGCPRQVTGALITFGEPSVHEAARLASGSPTHASRTDAVYNTIRGRACGVRADTRCPQAALDRLDRDVAFVTVYPAFGATGRWLELLLYRGDLAASSVVVP